MDKLEKLKYFYKLKEVERNTRTVSRNESVADHVYSMLILSNYLLKISNRKLDQLKLTKLIIYHDVAEIGIEDTFVLNYKYNQEEKDKEMNHNKELVNILPGEMYDEYSALCQEYIDLSSIEARYASGIDALDPVIQSIDVADNWVGFSEEALRKHKEHRVEEFSEQKELFNDAVKYIKEKGYL